MRRLVKVIAGVVVLGVFAEQTRAQQAGGKLGQRINGQSADDEEPVRVNPLIKMAAAAFNQRGDSRFSRGDYDRAIAAYDQAIRLDPDLADAYTNRGVARTKKGDLDQAIVDYNEAIRLHPEDVEVCCLRAEARRLKGDVDQAIADCNELIRRDPHDARPFLMRGICWSDKRDNDRAITDYTEALRLNPMLARAYGARGSAWKLTGHLDRAFADYNEALRLDPKFVEALHGRGIAWLDKGDFDKAIADFTEALRLYPKSALTYAGRSFAWRSKGEIEKAVADANEARRLDPRVEIDYPRHEPSERKSAGTRAVARIDEAMGLGLNSAVSEMIQDSTLNSKRDSAIVPASAVPSGENRPGPSTAGEYVDRGIILNKNRAFPWAIVEFQNAIRLDPTCAAAYLNRGISWGSVGDFSRALADFDEAIRLNPELAGAHRNRGAAWGATGAYAQAGADFDDALRLDPNDFQALNSLARLCATCPDASHRDGARAVALATRACERTMWIEWEILDTLAAACAEAGDFDAAVKWQERVAALIGDRGAKTLGDGQDRDQVLARVSLYRARKPYRGEPAAK